MDISSNITIIIVVIIGILVVFPVLMKLFGSKSTEEMAEQERAKARRLADSRRSEATSVRRYEQDTEYVIRSPKKK
ncbi:MAG: hypothetical protein J7M18_08445 [Candidatus Eremiobacteraeota bacterium]|nr:hypothetical protein [Candidatus Eremiobacteraeota bacterium]